jgi:hypothetical protein
MDNLDISKMDLMEKDDRDYLILKMKEVNEKLIEKLGRLEEVVDKTVKKAYKATKRNVSSHRDWDNDADDDIKQKNKQIRSIQTILNS